MSDRIKWRFTPPCGGRPSHPAPDPLEAAFQSTPPVWGATASAAGVPLSDGDECTGNAEGEPVLCRAGRSSFWLTWDGRMIPCGMMASPGTPVLEQGFSAAWRSVRTEVEAIRLPAACAGCALRRHCNLCAASCFAETGDYDRKPDYICSLTHTLCRITREKYGTED